jgi:hypothetical protein
MVLEHPNSGELELFHYAKAMSWQRQKRLLVYNGLRGAGLGQPTNNKHREQQFGFGAVACRHARY